MTQARLLPYLAATTAGRRARATTPQEHTMDYGYRCTLATTDFDQALARVTDALKAQGFGVLTEIDVRATFRKKLDRDFRPYTILGACNPQLAWQALHAEPEIGLLLPCNVVVKQNETGLVEVSIIRPEAMFQVVDNDAMDALVAEVGQKLERVIAALAAT
jgi:uncharacterized protein (DUF302 family)